MSDAYRDPTADWSQAWLEAQRRALEQWLGSGDTAAAGLLGSGIERWWQLWGAQAPRTQRDAGDQLRRIGEQYLNGFRHVWTSLAGHAPDPTSADFQGRLQRALADLASGAAAGQFWSQLMPGFDQAAAPAGAAMWPKELGSALTEPWKLFFAVPALGPGREQQAEWSALQEALVAHQRLATELTATLAEVHRQALQRLGARVAARAQAGEPLTSFRAVYDEWVACGEEAFAEVAHSAEYAQLQAKLGDSDARLRIRVRGLLERWCRSLDLPTRTELDTAHRRIRDLGRRVEALEAQLVSQRKGSETALAELRAEVAASRDQQRKAPAARRARAKRPSRQQAKRPEGETDAHEDT
ncbi:MAG TPA: poly(R)-hydroxyalkanoic acid synthase subunit PhaE [Steroidobacteraceae bacterium]|nr:poly(R)-hydroxyalkanoic acid synthase subunit PhaE [Steroidobacteraceae bacterium]